LEDVLGYKGSGGKRKLRRELPTPSFKYVTRPNPLLILGLLSCLSACTFNKLSIAAPDSAAPDLDTLIKSEKVPNNAGTQSGSSENTKPGIKADQPAGDETNQHPASPAVSELGEELEKKLEDLESHFFGHIYRSEPADKRVVRLERFVFGTESGGPLPSRINHVASTLTVADPDGTKREIKLHPKEAQPVAQEPSGQQPSQSTQETEQSGNNSIPNIVNSSEERTVKTPPEAAIPIATPMPTTRPNQMMVAPVMPAPGSDQSSKVLVLQVTKSTFATPGNPGESIRELDVAIRVHPSDADLMFERAKAWIQMDKFSSALNDLSDAILHDPNKSAYYLARAWCYKKLGNTYLAADDVKQARFVNPSLPPQIDLLQNSKDIVNRSAPE
jgi:hypothetical protein